MFPLENLYHSIRRGSFTMAKSTPKALFQTIYVNFMIDILDETDKYPEMKGFWLIMDNAPIHAAKKVGEIIE